MTSRHENRRIPETSQSSARDVLRTTDLDQRLVVLDRNGRVTVNLDRLQQVLKIPAASTEVATEIDTFAGPGTTGIVPDPLSASGRFLDDSGDWTAIPGGGDMLKCFHPETELLTQRGWRYVADVTLDDALLTLNEKTHGLEYQKPSKLYEYHYSGPLIGRETKQLAYLVTPNHRFLVRKWWANKKRGVWSPYGWETAEECADKIRAYPIVGKWSGVEPDGMFGLSPREWVRFMAWFLAEGSVYETRVYLCQIAASEHYAEVGETMGALAKLLGRKMRKTPTQFSFRHLGLAAYLKQFGKSPERWIPDGILSATPELGRLFIETYAKGDGCGGSNIGTASRRMADNLQELALKAGGWASISVGIMSSWSRAQMWRVNINWNNCGGASSPHQSTIVQHDGPVYCVEVDNHIVYSRLGGRCVFTGQSTYDTDTDGIVDKAEQLEGPTAGANISTATAVAAHLAAAHAPTSAQYVTIALDATLTDERRLQVGASLALADGGAGGDATLTRAALTGDVTAAANANATTIANDAVTYAKMQNVSAASKLIGRGSAAGAGDPEEITLGTGLSMSGTTINSAGGSTPTGTGFRHVTAGVEDAATKLVDTADVNAAQITYAKIQNVAALSVVGRSANSAGVSADVSASAASAAVLRESGSTIGFGTVATAGIADAAITSAKLRDSVALSVIGRSANSTGVPADISTSAASAAVLRESGSTVGFGTVATAGIADAAITSAKLRDSAALTVIGRSANSTGVPADIAASAASDSVLRESGSTIGFGTIATAGIAASAVTNAKLADMAANTVKCRAASTTGQASDVALTTHDLLGRAAGDIVALSFNNSQWCGRTASGSLGSNSMTSMWQELVNVNAGTSFPGSPTNAQRYYRSDLLEEFFYEENKAKWISVAVYEIAFGDTASVTSGNYFKQYPISSATAYSSTYGEQFGFDVVVVGIVVKVGASSTCTITVQDDGADCTLGAISLSSATSGRSETLYGATSTVIASASFIGVKCTSGTATTSANGRVRFRRIA